MRYIEPHAHMVSRTTDDYQRMALAGCAAICEPAFWAGFDRSSADGFHDYFCQLTEHEPRRAAKFGLKHFSWLCINPKESEDVQLAAEVIALIPQFLDRPNVLGIGEIGLNKNSRNELKVLEMHVDLAARHQQLILVHTPHLEDKLKGTRLILDVLKSDRRIQPGRVIIDHVEEHTVKLVLDAGFWAGMTLYPETKCTQMCIRDSKEIGAIAVPDKIQFAPGLPKTRSGKIMRRILRKIAENQTDQIGDVSTLADPAVVESLVKGKQ